MAERHDHRSSDEIRRDIEGTRTELRETVVALERKLSLGQIVDEVWGRVGGPRTAGAAAANVGDAIREYPVPLALMGLGVAWLAVDKATGSPSRAHTGVGPGTYERAEGRVGPYRGDAAHETSGPSVTDRAKHRVSNTAEDMKQKASGAAGTLKDKASAMAGKAKGLASDAKEKVRSSGDGESNGDSYEWYRGDEESGMRERAGEAADRARDVADRARGRAARGAEKAKHSFRSVMDDQPLALGAVAFGLGLASGLATPTTRWEDQTMGEAADAVKDEAGSFVKDAARDVKEVAASAAGAAKDEAESQSGQIKESVKSIATEAKETAKEEMHNRDLDTKGVKGRASRSRDRTEERLSD